MLDCVCGDCKRVLGTKGRKPEKGHGVFYLMIMVCYTLHPTFWGKEVGMFSEAGMKSLVTAPAK